MGTLKLDENQVKQATSVGNAYALAAVAKALASPKKPVYRYTIDRNLPAEYRGTGTQRSYRLIARGQDKWELALHGLILEIDPEGNELDRYEFQHAPSEVLHAAHQMIDDEVTS